MGKGSPDAQAKVKPIVQKKARPDFSDNIWNQSLSREVSNSGSEKESDE